MSSIDLRVEGNPDACDAEAQACRHRAALADAAWFPCETGARLDPAIFEGLAAEEFTVQARQHSVALTDAENALFKAAEALEHHATVLRSLRSEFRGMRDAALAAGLPVTAQHIRRPTDGDDKKQRKFQELVHLAAHQRQREDEASHELLRSLRSAARDADFKGELPEPVNAPPRDYGHVDKPTWTPPTPDKPDESDRDDESGVDDDLPTGPATTAPSTSAPTPPADLVSNNHPSNPPTNPASVHAGPGLLTSPQHTTAAQLWAQPAVWAATLTRPHLHANEASWLDDEAQPV